ncbi:MAG: LPS export ABC transporter permease LptG [Parahaliea sp.]
MHGLDLYIGRTVVVSVALVLAIIVGLDAVTAFIDEMDDVSQTYTAGEILVYIVLTVPGRLYEFTPFAALIGCLMGLGQLASSSELVVMRGAGVSIARLVWIVFKPALLIALLAFILGEYVAPAAEQLAQSRRALAQNPGEGVAGRHGLWNREANSYLHFNALAPDGTVHGIILLRFDDKQALQSAVRAQSADFAGDHWLLRQAIKTDFSSWQTTSSEHTSLRWDTAITPELLAMEVVSPDRLPLVDLYRYSRYLARQGLDADDFELAMWRKLLQPLAVTGLVLVAISFIFGPLRDGTLGFRIFAGVIVGIIFRTSQDLLGPASLVFGFAPLYAALIPVVLCFLFAMLLLRRTR